MLYTSYYTEAQPDPPKKDKTDAWGDVGFTAIGNFTMVSKNDFASSFGVTAADTTMEVSVDNFFEEVSEDGKYKYVVCLEDCDSPKLRLKEKYDTFGRYHSLRIQKSVDGIFYNYLRIRHCKHPLKKFGLYVDWERENIGKLFPSDDDCSHVLGKYAYDTIMNKESFTYRAYCPSEKKTDVCGYQIALVVSRWLTDVQDRTKNENIFPGDTPSNTEEAISYVKNIVSRLDIGAMFINTIYRKKCRSPDETDEDLYNHFHYVGGIQQKTKGVYELGRVNCSYDVKTDQIVLHKNPSRCKKGEELLMSYSTPIEYKRVDSKNCEYYARLKIKKTSKS